MSAVTVTWPVKAGAEPGPLASSSTFGFVVSAGGGVPTVIRSMST